VFFNAEVILKYPKIFIFFHDTGGVKMSKEAKFKISLGIFKFDMADRKKLAEYLGDTPVEYIWGFADSLCLMSDRKLKEYKNWLDGRGLQIDQIHSPFGKEYDFSDSDRHKRFNVIESEKALLRKLQIIGIKHNVIHCSPRIDKNCKKEHLKRFKDSLHRLLPVAEEVGITIALENLPPENNEKHIQRNSGIGSAHELKEILDDFESPGLGVCFDIAHANLSKDIKKEFSLIKDRIVTFHIHDNDGERDLHLPPPYGTIDWIWFVKELRKMKYSGTLPMEAHTFRGISTERYFDDMQKLFNNPETAEFYIMNRIVKIVSH